MHYPLYEFYALNMKLSHLCESTRALDQGLGPPAATSYSYTIAFTGAHRWRNFSFPKF